MFLHARDWASALRVAENHDPGSVADVLVAQANAAAASRDWATAEALLIDARRPDLAVEMYLHARSFPEALRVTKRHLAHKLAEVNERIKRAVARSEIVMHHQSAQRRLQHRRCRCHGLRRRSVTHCLPCRG